MDDKATNTTITRADFQELKSLYAKAVSTRQDTFVFRGRTVLTAYAKYLIEYLEGESYGS